MAQLYLHLSEDGSETFEEPYTIPHLSKVNDKYTYK